MTTTDHAQAAQVVLDKIAKKSGGNFSIDQALALVSAHATLAVAHELRTANLIAAISAGYLLGHDHEDEAWGVEIRPRLGLDGGAK